ncbi:acetyltransferase-like isoleucine patch superfamily enzyme [Sediminihabitans luteus]|uniref:Acetyltransferase-like isoleucine patch superfamily enzyme n=1 Tax=Sediminihabitans luteus TaxID=1138585 RepID=A0A2M9CDD5_9CELL|nr:acyltransferase [Sediminihabitans luteus]PJJ69872.1 acetyltransferase-like isoleucine patch superfamily enzyme [Sediminihabitans luteus]GII99191.1 hypothetical protein Slu03_15690 [Sediminihabitans luteus]
MTRYGGAASPTQARRAEMGLLARAGEMYARGLLRKPLFGTSGGPLFIGRGTRLTSLADVHHAGRLVIEDGAEVQGLATGGLRFGQDVSIGQRAAIRPSSYYGGEIGEGLAVGDRSSFATGCFVGCSGTITIGSDVMVGPGAMLFSENHRFDDLAAPIKSQGVERGRLVVEDDCWIGARAMLLSGVTVGRGSVVAAGSVVTADVPPHSVVAGVPARVVRDRAPRSAR